MKKAVSVIVALIFMFNGTLHLASALEDDISLERYTDLITKYYEAINNKDYDSYLDLIGSEYKDVMISALPMLIKERIGLGVIKSVDLKSIKIIADVSKSEYSEINSIKRNEDSKEIYSMRNFLVKCDMEVYNENDYYFSGNNYASIICGFVNGELRVIDDKLPLPDEVAEYEPDKTSILDYINNRFAEERQGLYLSDKFIDEYKETATYNGIMPSSIK